MTSTVPAGSAADFRFPYADEDFDLVVLTSVFTHMLPDGGGQLPAGDPAGAATWAGAALLPSFFGTKGSTGSPGATPLYLSPRSRPLPADGRAGAVSKCGIRGGVPAAGNDRRGGMEVEQAHLWVLGGAGEGGV